MDEKKGLSPLSALVIIIGIICATFIGYKIAQGNRYVVMGMDNEFLWDSWKKEILFKRPDGIYSIKGID